MVAAQAIDTSLRDAGVYVATMDGGSHTSAPGDAASTNGCPTLDVCVGTTPGLLYNVCVTGVSGPVSQPACLVDPNGVLYLAPLTSGQLIAAQGWTQSMNATLSATDQARCESARSALLTDGGTRPKCAGP